MKIGTISGMPQVKSSHDLKRLSSNKRIDYALLTLRYVYKPKVSIDLLL